MLFIPSLSVSEWSEIVIPASAGIADDIAAIITDEIDAAHSGTQIRSGSVVLWTPLDRCEQVLADTQAVIARLASHGFSVDPQAVHARPAIPEEQWRNAWKRHFHVTRLTRQVVVVPSWETHQPAPDDVVIHLDPGQAFGTGLHASTRLVLTEMQALRDAGSSVQKFFDLGTGSAILAIAAARFWPASRGLAVDIDPLAVAAATENCALNRVTDQVTCRHGSAADVSGEFDLVLANIQAHVLLDLQAAIALRVAPGGRLILSGLLTSLADSVARRYAGAGFAIEATRQSQDDPEWTGVRLIREA